MFQPFSFSLLTCLSEQEEGRLDYIIFLYVLAAREMYQITWSELTYLSSAKSIQSRFSVKTERQTSVFPMHIRESSELKDVPENPKNKKKYFPNIYDMV